MFRSRSDRRHRGPRVRLRGRALRLTIFIGESDRWHRVPLYYEILQRARGAGLAGVSVFRGIEGFGASSQLHTTRVLSLTEDLPLAVVIVDDVERIRGFMPQLDEIVEEGIVIVDEVEVVRYVGRDKAYASSLHPGHVE